MRMIFSIVLLCLVCLAFCTSGLYMVFEFTGESPGELPAEAIRAGKIHLFFGMPDMRRLQKIVLDIPRLVIFHIPTLMMTLAFVVVAVWLLRLRCRTSWLPVGLVCLLLPLLLWVLGLILLNSNTDLHRGTRWCAYVLLCCMQSLFACMAVAIAEAVAIIRRRTNTPAPDSR